MKMFDAVCTFTCECFGTLQCLETSAQFCSLPSSCFCRELCLQIFLLFIWDTLLISPSTKYVVTRLTDLIVRLCSENNLRELVK
jgi:hypothetical protein